tara:strand:- start:756 stop:866 length:111 start_codon:yes stop_codon:yes gene_type:complete
MKIGPIGFYFTVIITMGFGILPLALLFGCGYLEAKW